MTSRNIRAELGFPRDSSAPIVPPLVLEWTINEKSLERKKVYAIVYSNWSEGRRIVYEGILFSEREAMDYARQRLLHEHVKETLELLAILEGDLDDIVLRYGYSTPSPLISSEEDINRIRDTVSGEDITDLSKEQQDALVDELIYFTTSRQGYDRNYGKPFAESLRYVTAGSIPSLHMYHIIEIPLGELFNYRWRQEFGYEA